VPDLEPRTPYRRLLRFMRLQSEGRAPLEPFRVTSSRRTVDEHIAVASEVRQNPSSRDARSPYESVRQNPSPKGAPIPDGFGALPGPSVGRQPQCGLAPVTVEFGHLRVSKRLCCVTLAQRSGPKWYSHHPSPCSHLDGFRHEDVALPSQLQSQRQAPRRRRGRQLLRQLPIKLHRRWGLGSGPYTRDSSICTSAVHAGVITTSGGILVATIAPGGKDYTSTEAHGITSYTWSSYDTSPAVAAPPAEPHAAPKAASPKKSSSGRSGPRRKAGKRRR